MPELRLSRSLYDEQSVTDAVQAFSKLARIAMDTHESEFVLKIDDAHPHFADRLEDELANYVLHATALKRGAKP